MANFGKPFVGQLGTTAHPTVEYTHNPKHSRALRQKYVDVVYPVFLELFQGKVRALTLSLSFARAQSVICMSGNCAKSVIDARKGSLRVVRLGGGLSQHFRTQDWKGQSPAQRRRLMTLAPFPSFGGCGLLESASCVDFDALQSSEINSLYCWTMRRSCECANGKM